METYLYPASFSTPQGSLLPNGFKLGLTRNQADSNPDFPVLKHDDPTLLINGLVYDLIGYDISVPDPEGNISSVLNVPLEIVPSANGAVGAVLYINIKTPGNDTQQALAAVYYEDSVRNRDMLPQSLYTIEFDFDDDIQNFYVAENQFTSDLVSTEQLSAITIPPGSAFTYPLHITTMASVLPSPDTAGSTKKLSIAFKDKQNSVTISVFSVEVKTSANATTKKGPIAIKTYGSTINHGPEKELAATKHDGTQTP